MVSDKVVAGSGWVTQSGEEEIWFVSQANGHIFSSTPENREVLRVTNTTIPQTKEVLITPDGKYVVYRYLGSEEVIKTYAASLTKATADDEVRYRVSGSFLPDNIKTISLSPNKNKLFYLQPTASGVVGVIYTLETEETQVIFNSAVRQWQSDWSTPDKITLFTAADIETVGFAYELSTNGTIKKIAEGSGLTAQVSPDGEYLLSSAYRNGS
jgi:Tol biopolymer transport system component